MKHLSLRARTLGAVALLALLAAAALYRYVPATAERTDQARELRRERLMAGRSKTEARRQELRNRKRHAQRDALTQATATPDLYYAQDAEDTRDPALGYAPRQELLTELKARTAVAQLRSGNATASALAWTSLGPNDQGGRTRAIVWDPNDITGRKVWSAGVSGGLWFNNNITSSTEPWQRVNDLWDNLNVSCIAVDPTNTQVMYVGTGEAFAGDAPGAGVWKTTNGGATWAQLPNSANMVYVNDLIVRNEGGVGVLYVGITLIGYSGITSAFTPRSLGLWRSTDGGTSFNQVLPNVIGGTSPYAVADLELGADNRLYVGTTINRFGEGGGRILYSDDGLTWTVNEQFLSSGSTPVTGARRVELATAPSNANVVYALIEERNPGSAAGAIARSTDRGQTFSVVSEPDDVDNGISAADFTRGQAFYDLILAVDPNSDNTVLVGGINLFYSINGGFSWSHASKWSNNPNLNTLPVSLVHADQHAIAYRPGSSSELIFGTDGGVYWTNNIGSSASSAVFRQRSLDQVTTQFYRGDVVQDATRFFAIGGTQDNGTLLINNSNYGGSDVAFGGDGAYCEFDPESDRLIVSYVFNNYYLYFNGFFGPQPLVEQNDGQFINPADADWTNNWLFSGAASGSLRITRITTSSLDVSSTVYSVSGMVGSARSIAVSPATSSGQSVVWVGTSAGRLYRCVWDGFTLSAEERGVGFFAPTTTLGSINFGPTESRMLVTFLNYGVVSCYQSTDAGMTWSSKEGNLPNLPVRDAKYNPKDLNAAFLATDLGVYYCTNLSASSPTWTLQSNGFANVRVSELRMNATLDRIFAFTYGRGIFSAPIPGTTSVETQASLISGVKVFPTLAREQVTVSLERPAAAAIELRLVGLDGRVLRTQTMAAGAESAQLNTANLAAGSYVVVLQSGRAQPFTQRILKQ